MTMGPREARLRAVLATADAGVVDTAALEWGAGAQLLEVVAGALENAAPAIGSQFGPDTGEAAREAFRRASTKVRGRARLMGEASTALGSAHAALVHAERVRDGLGAPLSEPQRPAPTPGPSTPDDVAAQRAYDSARAGYEAALSKRESDSAAAIEQMDAVYTASTETMKKVHGEPDPVTRTSGGDGSGGGSTSTSTSPVGTAPSGGHRSPTGGHPTYTTATSHPSEPTSSTPAHTVPSGGTHTSSTGGTSSPGGPGQQPGTAQGGNDAYPAGPSAGTPAAPGVPATGASSPTGLTAPTAGGLAGALGGGALGGLTGISGAVRGPSVLPPASAAGAGGRPIGSTTRTGATSGTLGRSGTATTGGGASAGSRGAGSRGGAGRGPAGSRGAAGARGSAVGGQGGRKDKDPRKKNTDFFEEEQDWVEDEGAAPGVID